MKGEERMIELLAESLKTQDRQADLLEKQGLLIKGQSEKIDLLVDVTKDMSGAIHHLTNSVESMIKKFDQISDHENRLRRIERRLDL